MKKWIAVACLLLVLISISIYFLIPAKLVVTRSVKARASQRGAKRLLLNDPNWEKWWLEPFTSKSDSGKILELNGYRFRKTRALFNSFEFVIEKNQQISTGNLHILPIGNDSVQMVGEVTMNTGINPFRKIQCYFEAREMGRRLDTILSSLKNYVSDVKNIYGIDIKEEKVKVEFLVSAKKAFDHYPTTSEVYELIRQIKNYVAQQDAKEEDFPMLHFWIADSSHAETQVAIPVNRKLPETGIFSSKRMLKNGNILLAEVVGGPNTVDIAMKQVEQYLSDHQYSNVAIPFQSLVTDRMNEPDTSKWVTRVYFPIR